MNDTAVDFVLTLPIGLEAHRNAQKLSQQQTNSKQAKQVYLNVLAVYAVNFYFDCTEIETDLAASEIWNAAVQKFMDVADLEVQDIGKLECRWVAPGADFVTIPAEVRSDRIGYVAVEMAESLKEAKLLGFMKKVDREKVAVSELESIENLLEYLHEIKPVNLNQWLHNVFDLGWEAAETMFATQPRWQASFRSHKTLESSSYQGAHLPVKRCKLVDLEQGEKVALAVELMPTDEEDIDISVEVYPASNQTELPEYLELMVLDDRGKTLVQARANKTDSLLFQLSAEPGERFSVKVALGDFSNTENFLA